MAGASSLSSLFSSLLHPGKNNKSSKDHSVVWGHRIPLPERDLYVALATVALFLPAVVVVHRSLAALFRVFVKPHRA